MKLNFNLKQGINLINFVKNENIESYGILNDAYICKVVDYDKYNKYLTVLVGGKKEIKKEEEKKEKEKTNYLTEYKLYHKKRAYCLMYMERHNKKWENDTTKHIVYKGIKEGTDGLTCLFRMYIPDEKIICNFETPECINEYKLNNVIYNVYELDNLKNFYDVKFTIKIKKYKNPYSGNTENIKYTISPPFRFNQTEIPIMTYTGINYIDGRDKWVCY